MDAVAVRKRFNYWRRVFEAYVLKRQSHLTFWHGTPDVNENARADELGEYYMGFAVKADYPGHHDSNGIPMLDYQGVVGLQYNPIAIAQYGLGNYNLFRRTGDSDRRAKFLGVADWLVDNIKQNPQGIWVWRHEFDWEYRTPLKAGWFSALSQGQGVSLLVRAHAETGDERYSDAAARAFESFCRPVEDGGVTYVDADGFTWFEETIVDPPTHILNGFLWASWGVYDYVLHTKNPDAERLFGEAVRTLKENLRHFDTSYWSLYEQSGTRMKMMASPFYHHLHVIQLTVMHRLTGEALFADYARRWEAYRVDPIKRRRALAYKAVFKIAYY